MTSRRSYSNDSVGPEKLTPSVRRGRYCFESFMQEPLCFVKGTITAPAGTSLTENIVNTGRHAFEYAFLGDATDALLPVLASEGGYNWVFTTATLDRGVEVNFGGLKDGHPRNFIPTSEDCFARILLITEDASGSDLFFGFRRVAAYAATLTEYSDMVGIRILGDSSSTTGAFTIITVANNAGATDYTSTTPIALPTPLEDATAIELEVRWRGAVAKFFVNGVEIVGSSFTADSGDVFSPAFRALQTTDISSQIKTLGFECGLLGQDGSLGDRQDATLISLVGATT